jgi:sporulation protein YlmC with PRC-barrel domain
VNLQDQDVFAENEKIGKVKDLVIETDEWKITHLEIELTKKAAEEILGAAYAVKSMRNRLAISALEKGVACGSDMGVEIKVSKWQLHIYLRPV